MVHYSEDAPECFISINDGVVSLGHASVGPFPVIVPCKGVVVTINDVAWEQEVTVRLGDKIEIVPLGEERKGTWVLSISTDGLTATIQIKPTVRIARKVVDSPASTRLLLKVAEEVEYLSPVNLDALMSAMRQEGIRVGVDLKAMTAVVSSKEEGLYVLARGQQPTPGKDAEAEVLFEQSTRTTREFAADATVDYRTRFEYPSVREGQILVRKIPRVLGQNGTTVRGDAIFAKEPSDIDLIPGDGVKFNEETYQLIAVTRGRPIITKRQRSLRVDIRADMAVSGDVDLRSGNVAFLGDVTIQGDVTAGFSVWAGGIIKVRGLAENCHLQACGAVEVQGNIMSSQVFVGPPPGLTRTISPLLRELERETHNVLLAIDQLKKKIPNDKRSFSGRLVNTLIEQRLVGFDERVRHLRQAMHKLDRRLHDFFGAGVMSVLVKFLDETHAKGRTEEHLLELQGSIGTLHARLEELSARNTYLSARNVINSTLISTGDISVVNGGCYNSWLQAGGKVTVQGVVRGGEIRAGADTVVKELGSESGVSAKIHVPSTAKVLVGTAWEHSVVVIGSREHRFDQKQSGVVVYLEGHSLVVK